MSELWSSDRLQAALQEEILLWVVECHLPPLAALDRPRRTITDCTMSVVGLSSHDRCSNTGSDIVFVSDSDHQGKVVVVVADDSRRPLVRLSTGSGPPEERVEWCRSADRSDEDES